MTLPPDLTDRSALLRNRARAMAAPAMFLQHEAVDEVKQRLEMVNRTFTSPAIVSGFPNYWADVIPGAHMCDDNDVLDLTPQAHDLVVHAMAMHWANDPVGQLVQARRALKPDGLFLGVMFGGQTLSELRLALAEAETAVTGGLSPRVAPMGEIRDLGALLQRAGFALPVADALTLSVSYATLPDLMRDLRAMGEANALAARNRRPLRRAVLEQTGEIYRRTFGVKGRLPATFELIVLTGWAPSDDQPQPLRPGSANTRLADALNTQELPLGEPGKPSRV
ncbi:MAG: SAM-dependent methyltransferase [Paracoccaceae bacterium]